MRTYGRIWDAYGHGTWVEIATDPNTGDNSAIWVTTLIQTLKLSRNESPFYANYGIPAQLAVAQRVFPDIYVFQTQQQFAPYFASLIISRMGNQFPPTYLINLTTLTGALFNFTLPT
jgi:hypothetical protein